ncbi:hypothetical protein HAX54_005649 [Datura stramonium]|uniref:F-box/kelch-repeat protein n=1 Tax=Datura stramonium TaxID=4076 RepID=A0ABS8WYF9_DATST|nr:hypothetical protein [Datura stramonium]
MNYSLERIEVQHGKRPLENNEENEVLQHKLPKLSDSLNGSCSILGRCRYHQMTKLLLEWEAFDPSRCRWMHLPSMNSNECFVFSDKESLAVGTELLVFGKEILSHVIYRYSILTNTWSSGMQMNAPRCLFGSASLGEIAILAGGCDSQGSILSSAELYNSETGALEDFASMNKPRRLPERAASMNGWGLAFRACGDKLIVIGGPRPWLKGILK